MFKNLCRFRQGFSSFPGQNGDSKRRKGDIILKKRKLTFHELVEKNKEELLRDDHVLAKIEERLAEKHEQTLRASS